MPQSFASLHCHVVFSTKHRQPLISSEFQPRLFEYIGGILRNHSSALIVAGGMPDHVHLQWQIGYGAFAVSYSNIDAVKDYCKSQEKHHRAQTFQDEFRELLRRHNLEWDERYVWD
jgi:putative transposase